MQKRTAFLFLALSIILTSLAQLMMKTGMLGLGELSFNPAFFLPLVSGEKLLPMAWIIGGLIFYAISMAAWIAVLTRIELSVAYPYLSLSYILVYLGAIMLPYLNETVSWVRLAGILLISIGLFLITRSRKLKDFNS